jgi:uncharacterized membrane protein
MKIFLIALILFFIIDIPYLYFIAGPHYSNLIQTIQGSPLKIKYLGAFLSYLIMAFAIQYLVIERSKNIKEVLYYGMLTGFVAYGLYDFTNYATFDKWTLRSSLQDLIWGTLLFTIVSYFTYYINKYFF